RADHGRKVYRGAELETIGMPCGGVAAGQLYVRGDGTLAQWWIANNSQFTGYGADCYKTYRPPSPLDQGFAILLEGEGGERVRRDLSREGFDAIEFIGEYPIAEIRYRTREKHALPVEVDLEVFSPFIPLNAKDSSLPVTVMRFSVRNTSDGAVAAHLVGRLQNAVLLHEADEYAGRGMSRNRAVSRDGLSAVVMDFVEAPPPPKQQRREAVFEDFEDGDYEGWTITGKCFGDAPATGTLPQQQKVSGWHGKGFVNTYLGKDDPQGIAVSRPFTITEPYIAFLIGGGNHKGTTCMNLVVDGKAVRTATGRNKEQLALHVWSVRELKGKQAHLAIVDKHSGAWGHVNVDHIRFTNFMPAGAVPPPAEHPGFGEMCLAALAPGAKAGTAAAGEGSLAPEAEATFPLGDEAKRGVVAVPVSLRKGETKDVTFLVTWYFPQRPERGRMYANWFDGALSAAEYVAANFDRLSRRTHLFRDTYFDTTLPYWLAARLAMPVANLATETVQWWANGRFWAWEGVCCCPGTCTHVWNYEHAMARLFPELERSARLAQDLEPTAGFDEKTGLVGFRSNRAYAADGQCGTVLKVYREHLMSADTAFLEKAWPATQMAIEFAISHDENADGLIEDSQHNTFDINFIGPNTFVGSLYLGALRAAEEMARTMGDHAAAGRYRRIFESGSRQTMKRLWDGEYFTQIIPKGASDRHQYDGGCLSDQMFGQGWAHQVGLGYLYPREAVRSALASVYKYNWTGDVGPYNARHKPERWFARAGDAGLFTCTWPKGNRPKEPVRYRDEVWTGIEYQVAGHMLWEGLVREALAIVRGIHERYDGTHYNPWNEVECGDHYARALASWGCLIGIEGYTCDGPAGRIGFAPRMTPADFKALFTAAEGWGSLVQQRAAGRQTSRIELAWGRLRARTLVFELPKDAGAAKVAVTAAGKAAGARLKREGQRVTLTLDRDVVVEAGEAVETVLTW
ncbi:MAG: GH116 family glycosyl hydrolase, partial [Planctomycetota bacterium]|nr:GH116 family glycosyl hydrolase [Planctomycetota bacterium]